MNPDRCSYCQQWPGTETPCWKCRETQSEPTPPDADLPTVEELRKRIREHLAEDACVPTSECIPMPDGAMCIEDLRMELAALKAPVVPAKHWDTQQPFVFGRIWRTSSGTTDIKLWCPNGDELYGIAKAEDSVWMWVNWVTEHASPHP